MAKTCENRKNEKKRSEEEWKENGMGRKGRKYNKMYHMEPSWVNNKPTNQTKWQEKPLL